MRIPEPLDKMQEAIKEVLAFLDKAEKEYRERAKGTDFSFSFYISAKGGLDSRSLAGSLLSIGMMKLNADSLIGKYILIGEHSTKAEIEYHYKRTVNLIW